MVNYLHNRMGCGINNERFICMTRTDKVRIFLSDWQFWTGIAYFGIAATVVALFFLFNRTAREEAFRAAGVKAAATSQVAQCFTSYKNGPVTRGFIASHEAIIENSIISNREALKAQPTSPLTAIRKQSLARLEAAKENANELQVLISKTIPTRNSCIELAHRLNIDPSRYLRQSLVKH